MGTFPYPNDSLEFFVPAPHPKNTIFFFPQVEEQGFLVVGTRMGCKNIFWEVISLLLSHKPKAQKGFFWNGNSLLLQKIPEHPWSVGMRMRSANLRTALALFQCPKIGYSDFYLPAIRRSHSPVSSIFFPLFPKEIPGFPPLPQRCQLTSRCTAKGILQPKHCCFILN